MSPEGVVVQASAVARMPTRGGSEEGLGQTYETSEYVTVLLRNTVNCGCVLWLCTV